MKGYVPMLSRKLRDLGIKNFEELHRFGVQKESNLTQDKKFFSNSQSIERESVGSSSTSGPSYNIQISVVQAPRKFSNLGRPLSNVFEKLIENNLIRPLPQKPPYPGVDQKFYYKYHQNYGHDTDGYVRLRHEVQNLINSGKITDPESKNQTPEITLFPTTIMYHHKIPEFS